MTTSSPDPVLPGYAGTRGVDLWKADADLRAAAGLADDTLPRAFSAELAGELGEAIERAHHPDRLPRLVEKTIGGEKVSAIEYCADQIAARRALARAMYGRGPRPLKDRMALAVLSNYAGEAGINCPLAMTEGLIGLLENRGTPQQKKLLIKLRSDDPEWALTGGQFVTERQGGSNVSANETVAAPAGAEWKLTGTKWFCSNPGEAWVATAKPAGTDVVALFLVRRRDEKGRLNGHRILRKKEIGGTRGKATVEVEFTGARAEMIGRPREGLVILIDEIISVSRLHVAASALGLMGRARLEAETFAAWRTAYGRNIGAFAYTREKLSWIRDEHRRCLKSFFACVDAIEANGPEADALIPVNKIEVSRRATAIVREAQLIIGGHGILDDFSPLNRLADDAIVNEIWEGTHPILAGHAAKALRKPRSGKAFLSRFASKALIAGVETNLKLDEEGRSLHDPKLCALAFDAVVEKP